MEIDEQYHINLGKILVAVTNLVSNFSINSFNPSGEKNDP